MKAPVVIFAYRRLAHIRNCIQHLLENVGAKDSTVIIYSDGPKSEKDLPAVNEVREYLRTISGFGELRIIERKENLGLSRSIIRSVGEVLDEFGKIIVLEDDLITSKHFLSYMNDALDRYKDHEDVISIHGYTYPMSKTLPSLFFLRGADCWGWATWKRGWDLLNCNGEELLEEIRSKKLEREFNFNNSYDYLQMLQHQIDGMNDSWAILWYASAFLKNKLTLYPAQSLVHNAGNDDSGTHSKLTSRFDVELGGKEFSSHDFPNEIVHSDLAFEAFAEYFRKINYQSLPVKILSKITRLFK